MNDTFQLLPFFHPAWYVRIWRPFQFSGSRDTEVGVFGHEVDFVLLFRHESALRKLSRICDWDVNTLLVKYWFYDFLLLNIHFFIIYRIWIGAMWWFWLILFLCFNVYSIWIFCCCCLVCIVYSILKAESSNNCWMCLEMSARKSNLYSVCIPNIRGGNVGTEYKPVVCVRKYFRFRFWFYTCCSQIYVNYRPNHELDGR